jgi:hypothetical protein
MNMLRNPEDVDGRTKYFPVLQVEWVSRLYSHCHAPVVSFSHLLLCPIVASADELPVIKDSEAFRLCG